MSHRVIGFIGSFFLLACLGRSVSSSQSPSPPLQPDAGPGGKQYAHTAITKNRYGEGVLEYWLYEPDAPRPSSAPLIVFLHGWGGTNPVFYGAWLDHLVKRGNIVVYPRYQADLRTPVGEFTPNTIGALKQAIRRCQTEPGHVRPELNKFAVVGHSVGGLLAVNVAALAGDSGLPQVRAVMSAEPGRTGRPLNVPLADLGKIPGETLLLTIAGDRDTLVRDTDAKRIYYESTRVSAGNKDFITLSSDAHGSPALNADHSAPTAPDQSYDNGERAKRDSVDRAGRGGLLRGRLKERRQNRRRQDALDFYGLWKLFDALCDAAFYGKNRESALGNTQPQRFMGVWSDGVRVKELTVTDKP